MFPGSPARLSEVDAVLPRFLHEVRPLDAGPVQYWAVSREIGFHGTIGSAPRTGLERGEAASRPRSAFLYTRRASANEPGTVKFRAEDSQDEKLGSGEG